MVRSNPSQRVSRRVYHIVRRAVHVMTVAVLLGLVTAVYLHVRGVPQPIVRKVVSYLNGLGLPFDIERISLTLHGWRAENVRCYSLNPDDLVPVIQADELFLRRNITLERRVKGSRCLDFSVRNITICPSVDWCVGLPEESSLRHLERLDLSLYIAPDRIQIRDARIPWQQFLVRVDGTFIQPPSAASGKPTMPGGRKTRPMMMHQAWYQQFENALQALEPDETVPVDLDFFIDPAHPELNRCAVSLEAGSFRYRGVPFNRAGMALSYEAPVVELKHAAVHMDSGVFEIRGSYATDTKRSDLFVENSISSSRLLLLLPQSILHALSTVQIESRYIPAFKLQLGPAEPKHLIRKITGSFALRDTYVSNLKIQSLAGELSRSGGRLTLYNLQGEVSGLPERAGSVQSSMAGGTATGEVFWDADSHEFGVLAEGGFDPNLLLGPLSPVPIATNVIRRFRFGQQPPQLRLELGACYDDWKTFFLSISGTGRDMYFHDVPLSSLNANAYYERGILSLDPLVAQQGAEFVKGSVSLDFHESEVHFDASGRINPASIEDVVYPGLGIFSRYVQVKGGAEMSARGRVNWDHMRTTDFSAEVNAGRVELPLFALDQFSATVKGKGPVIDVGDAAFGLFGGRAEGAMSILLDPTRDGVPYKIDLKANQSEFLQWMQYIYPESSFDATGELSGWLHASSDFSSGFLESAQGEGEVTVRNGQLADLPLFRGFSTLMRRIIPSFSFFTIDRLSGRFQIRDGALYSDNMYFDGDVLSAKGRGSYHPDRGFDAVVQAQVMRENNVSRFFRFFTDPILKLFQVRLKGSLQHPEWQLDALSGLDAWGGDEE